MGIPDKVTQLINEEVDRRIHEKLCGLVEKVSELYSVPLKIARRDLISDSIYCMGVKKNGSLCTSKAALDGYCMFHVNDSRPHKPLTIKDDVRHNHIFPSALQDNCQACAVLRKNRENSNQFRDLSTIM